MEIIIGHINTDFDCLASMVAAKKLYPQAQLVLPGNMGRDVREFINLYRDIFNFIESSEVDVCDLTRIVIVDTHSLSRIGQFREFVNKTGIETIIYDHHKRCEDEIPSTYLKVEEVGANTTILMEEIINKGIEISPVEATILALGIYVDTNSLTFSGTTYRDAYALGYLLEKEANLAVIESLLTSHLSPKQQELSEKLNKNIILEYINGFEVGFSIVETESYVDDASYLTRRILEERNLDAFFSVMRMGHKTYIIGRSFTDEIDLSVIMKLIGGGGHKGAGSAKSDEPDLQKIYSNLKTVLVESISPKLKLKDIMSSPVKTVPDDTSIDEAYKIMLRYGHSGMPVVRDGNIEGIISRRDIDKARIHGLGKSPVKGYMSKKVITIGPEVPIKEAQHLFAEHNIGRLPVVDGSNMIGIVTRTDIIRTLYGGKFQKKYLHKHPGSEIGKDYTSENLLYKIDELPERVKEILKGAGETAEEDGYNIYVVGGFVRDLILGVENFDIDLVVEGNAIAFARKFAERFGAGLTEYDKFQTALALIEDDLKIDIVTARKEYYEFPAALPVVEKGSIKDDLFRRDFTINSIAMKLNPNDFGKIVDFYGGRRDLYDGIIRILYNFSFIEDPTRIFRAVRFEQRYGFMMEEKTEGFAIDAVNSDVLDKISRERINFEFFLMLKEKNLTLILDRMKDLKLLERVYPEIILSEDINILLEKSVSQLEEFNNSLRKNKKIDKILIYLMVLYSNIQTDNACILSDKLRLTREYRDEIMKFLKVRDIEPAVQFNKKELSNYDIYTMFTGLSLESLYVIYLMSDSGYLKNAVLDYINNISTIKTCITGNELKELGISPGPEYKKILKIVLKEKINGKISTHKEEIKYVKMLNIKNEEKQI